MFILFAAARDSSTADCLYFSAQRLKALPTDEVSVAKCPRRAGAPLQTLSRAPTDVRTREKTGRVAGRGDALTRSRHSLWLLPPSPPGHRHPTPGDKICRPHAQP